MEKTIYDLELHKEIHLKNSQIYITRVPWGWIYENYYPKWDMITSSVFVPFNKEFI